MTFDVDKFARSGVAQMDSIFSKLTALAEDVERTEPDILWRSYVPITRWLHCAGR